MPSKTRAPYRPFEYLEAGADYREFALAKELDRVPSKPYPLDAEQTRRLERILAIAPLVSSHGSLVVNRHRRAGARGLVRVLRSRFGDVRLRQVSRGAENVLICARAPLRRT